VPSGKVLCVVRFGRGRERLFGRNTMEVGYSMREALFARNVTVRSLGGLEDPWIPWEATIKGGKTGHQYIHVAAWHEKYTE
jgi:hypothetical protein